MYAREILFCPFENIANANWIFTEMVQYSTNPFSVQTQTRTWDFTNRFIACEEFLQIGVAVVEMKFPASHIIIASRRC